MYAFDVISLPLSISIFIGNCFIVGYESVFYVINSLAQLYTLSAVVVKGWFVISIFYISAIRLL